MDYDYAVIGSGFGGSVAALRLAEKARGFDVDVTLRVWDEMVHVFQLISFLPEAKRSLEQIADFVNKNTTERQR